MKTQYMHAKLLKAKQPSRCANSRLSTKTRTWHTKTSASAVLPFVASPRRVACGLASPDELADLATTMTTRANGVGKGKSGGKDKDKAKGSGKGKNDAGKYKGKGNSGGRDKAEGEGEGCGCRDESQGASSS